MKRLEVLFAPAEFEALAGRDLSQTTAVVFDVLRATTTIITALVHGAAGVVPVASIEEALQRRENYPNAILAGEREGFRITRELTGSIDFDLGNSPREFTPEMVAGKIVVMTTTNGTRALRAAAPARETLVGSLRNLPRLSAWLRQQAPHNVLVVCSGTHEEASFEDTLGAGALVAALWDIYGENAADSARIARMIYLAAKDDLTGAATLARNGRRLLGIPELRDDVPFCLHVGGAEILAGLDKDGLIRAWERPHATA